MDIKSLEAFVRLYELNSLRKTAAALYLSPQGLRRTIQALEGELGVVLFDRSAKGMVPTDTTEYFYNYASEMLRSYGRVTSDLKKIESRPRELTFVCSYGVMNSLPYERFVRFKESHPSTASAGRNTPTPRRNGGW